MTESQQIQGRRSGASAAQPHEQPRRDGQAPRVEPDHDSHGQSTASWTAVIVVMAGALVMAIAVVITTTWLFVVGAVLALAGGVLGKVLSAAGFGVSGRPGH